MNFAITFKSLPKEEIISAIEWYFKGVPSHELTQ